MKLKRPHTIEEWANTYNWPESAIAELHRGLNVSIVPNSLWDIRWMEQGNPVVAYTESEPPIMPPITETTIKVNTLHNQVVCNYGDVLQGEIIKLAAGMNRYIKESLPEKVFIQQGSYKFRQTGFLVPKWTLKTSIKYWTLKLLKRPIRWNTFRGIRTIELALKVNVGVLSGKRNT